MLNIFEVEEVCRAATSMVCPASLLPKWLLSEILQASTFDKQDGIPHFLACDGSMPQVHPRLTVFTGSKLCLAANHPVTPLLIRHPGMPHDCWMRNRCSAPQPFPTRTVRNKGLPSGMPETLQSAFTLPIWPSTSDLLKPPECLPLSQTCNSSTVGELYLSWF